MRSQAMQLEEMREELNLLRAECSRLLHQGEGRPLLKPLQQDLEVLESHHSAPHYRRDMGKQQQTWHREEYSQPSWQLWRGANLHIKVLGANMRQPYEGQDWAPSARSSRHSMHSWFRARETPSTSRQLGGGYHPGRWNDPWPTSYAEWCQKGGSQDEEGSSCTCPNKDAVERLRRPDDAHLRGEEEPIRSNPAKAGQRCGGSQNGTDCGACCGEGSLQQCGRGCAHTSQVFECFGVGEAESLGIGA